MSPEDGASEGGGQRWDPDRYVREAGFVAELGRPLLALLAPKSGERILDLGCGDGRLTLELAQSGAEVVGCDRSIAQLAAAQAQGVRVCCADGAALPFAGRFDAVFSNAALHWMPQADSVLVQVHSALRPGGRFVAEMGGAGNIARIAGVLTATLAQRGYDIAECWPWFFPTPEDYGARLARAGFRVLRMEHFLRQTPLPGDIAGWLHTFAESFLLRVPEAEREAIIEELRSGLAVQLREGDGRWVADYVRLRFVAVRAD